MCYSLGTLWTVAHQAPLSMGKIWSGLAFPPPEDLLDPGIEPTSPALVGEFFSTEPLGQPRHAYGKACFCYHSGREECVEMSLVHLKFLKIVTILTTTVT